MAVMGMFFMVTGSGVQPPKFVKNTLDYIITILSYLNTSSIYIKS